VIPEAAVEAAAKAHFENGWGDSVHWEDAEAEARSEALGDMRAALEAAAPHMIQAAKAEAWDEGHLMGWNEATANELPERESLWRNPNR